MSAAVSPEVLTPLVLTLKVAGCATLIALLAGILAGFGVARSRSWLRELADAAFTLPMVLPPTVLGYYLLVVFGRRGWIGAWLEDHLGLRLVFTWQGAALAASIVAFPLVFKGARTAFESIDPHLEKAARSLGFSEWKVFMRVTLPLAWRGVLGGTMLAFARATGEFGATLMIAGNIPGKTQTLSIAIYDAVAGGRDEQAQFLVIIISLLCVLVLLGAGMTLRGGYLRIRQH
jgi:molybdate transport system permease protein